MNRGTAAHRLQAHRNAEVKDRHYLFGRRASLERPFDVPARAGRIHVGDGVQGDADQFDYLRREDAALIDTADGEGEELWSNPGPVLRNGSNAVFHWPIARKASQEGVAGLGPPAVFMPAACISSRRMGAPRLNECNARTAAHLSTRRTSSRVAPASSAPRNMAARSHFIEIRASSVQREGEEFDFLARQHPAVPRVVRPEQQFGTLSIPFLEFVEGRAPQISLRRYLVHDCADINHIMCRGSGRRELRELSAMLVGFVR